MNITNLKQTLIIVVALLLTQELQSQVVDLNIVKRFDGSTVLKVFNIAKQTKLSYAQQNYLAVYYALSDSTAKAWLLQGKPIAQIDSLQQAAENLFFELNQIDVTTKSEYANKNAEKFAAIASKHEVDFIKEEYKPGDAEAKLMLQMVQTKYNFIYQRYLLNDKETFGAKQVESLYNLYSFFPAMYSNKFITDYLNKLLNVKPIPDSTQKKIRIAFLNVTKENKYSDWSKNLLDITRFFLPDTVYYAHIYGEAISNEAAVLSTVDKNNLIIQQHVSYTAYNSIYNLVFSKNYQNSLLQYTYGAFHANVADSLIQKNTAYYDALIKGALIRDGSLMCSNQFTIALKYKEYLKIDTALIDTLVYHAMYLSKIQDSIQFSEPFVWPDNRSYEAKFLSLLLSEDQYTKLLTIKNKPSSFVTAIKDWDELVLRKLSTGRNKDQTIIEMANFYIAKSNAWDRLCNEPKKQTANMRVLDQVKPQIISTLENARWNDTIEKKSNDLKLQW